MRFGHRNARFFSENDGGRKKFCCEGCKGIYQMLHEGDILEDEEVEENASSD
nr:heavy metal translocating P-type ATPase metal-binding domain-containing protein [Methylomarinum sp. Ch1-1]MDP4519106.1 heavy metal translocating P-type ATPase metal-binding domain-containing protein [Methylomarinum sp. Ch1-1]